VNLPHPLSFVEHDHLELSRRIAALHEEITALRRRGAKVEPMADDLVQALVELSEELFEHFAREEEELFPFVVRQLPDLAPKVAALVEGHDRICGAASRLLALKDRAPTRGNVDLAASLFQRLVEVYADHSGREMALFEAVAPRLDAAKLEEISALMREI
jgi:iron-sulfur cluster repair protein YtfE (RIC family)